MNAITRQIPNTLTLIRLILTVVYLWLFWRGIESTKSQQVEATITHHQIYLLTWSFWLFIIAAVTDFLDGYLARSWQCTSKFGRILDPLVDKLLISGGFVLFAIIGESITGIAWWMVVVILAREIFVTIARSILEAKGREFGAAMSGKIKMTIQCFAIGFIIASLGFYHDQAWCSFIATVLIWLAIISTIISGIIYIPALRDNNAKIKSDEAA